MKRATRIWMLMAGVIFMGASVAAQAQGRGHHRGHDKHDKHDRGNHHGHHRDHDRRDDDRHQHGRDHDYHRHSHRHVYHNHDRYCGHRTVVHHHRPRYVYYRDYNVYYDCHRNVYISYSGRSWSIGAAVPVCMNRVDISRVNHVELDYYDDDLPGYLSRGDDSYARY